MKNIFLLSTLLLVCSITANAKTQNSQSGVIEVIQSGFNVGEPYVLITFNPAPVLVDICASAGETRLAFNQDSEEGRTMLSMLLAAKMSGSTVEYRSYGCYQMTNGSVFEELSWIRF